MRVTVKKATPLDKGAWQCIITGKQPDGWFAVMHGFMDVSVSISGGRF